MGNLFSYFPYLFPISLPTDVTIETRTNVFSSAADDSPSTGLSIYKTSSKSLYEVPVATMECLEWNLIINGSHVPHDWVHVTVTWHEMWGLKVYINAELASETNQPQFISTEGFVSATHGRIGGVFTEDGNASSLGTILQMSDLRIWERFVSKQEILTNYITSRKYASYF